MPKTVVTFPPSLIGAIGPEGEQEEESQALHKMHCGHNAGCTTLHQVESQEPAWHSVLYRPSKCVYTSILQDA